MAARRLAEFFVVSVPTPMVTLRTEAAVLTCQVDKVERNILTGVRPGMDRLAVPPRLLTCKGQVLGQVFPFPNLLQVVVKITDGI